MNEGRKEGMRERVPVQVEGQGTSVTTGSKRGSSRRRIRTRRARGPLTLMSE